MSGFDPGDDVRVDITDTAHPEFEWHGEYGTVVEVLEDDVGNGAANSRANRFYRIELADYDRTLNIRHRFLRPQADE